MHKNRNIIMDNPQRNIAGAHGLFVFFDVTKCHDSIKKVLREYLEIWEQLRPPCRELILLKNTLSPLIVNLCMLLKNYQFHQKIELLPLIHRPECKQLQHWYWSIDIIKSIKSICLTYEFTKWLSIIYFHKYRNIEQGLK